MPNQGVTGRIVDLSSGLPKEGLIVEVLDKDGLFGDDRLGEDLTEANGEFHITYSPGKYGLEANPDLKINIYSPYRRLICQTTVFEDFADPMLNLGTITIPMDDLGGWLVTSRTEPERTLDPQGHTVPIKTPPLVSLGNKLTPVIDNESAWNRLTDEVRAATKSINLSQFYFDVGAVYTKFPPTEEIMKPHDPLPPTYNRLEFDLVSAQERGVDVRILIRDAQYTLSDIPVTIASMSSLVRLLVLGGLAGVIVSIPLMIVFLPLVAGIVAGALGVLIAYVSAGGGLPYPIDTADEVIEFFGLRPNPPAVREFRSAISRPMHAKFMVFDRMKGFFCVSPLTQDYYDSNNHLIDEPRRGPNAHQPIGLTMGQNEGTANMPVHDVSLLLEGPVVRDMDRTFFQLWNVSGPAEAAPGDDQYPGPIQTDDATKVQLVRTMSPNRFPGLPSGEQGALEAYLRAIENAKDYIYIEDQYYTVSAINEALLEALRTQDNLRVILLLNFHPDVLGYIKAQQNLIQQLLKHNSSQKDRVGVFTLWTVEQSGNKIRVVPNYIHSKLAIVDDVWATVGSANLDGPGMYRSVEMNVIMGSAIGGGAANTVAASLRRQLWKEHLGVTGDADPGLKTNGATMLKSWNDQAQKLVQRLNGGTIPTPVPRVLRYSFGGNAGKYLKNLGVSNPNLEILDKVPKFSFEKGAFFK